MDTYILYVYVGVKWADHYLWRNMQKYLYLPN